MLRRKRFLIGGIIVFLALGYLGYTALVGAATYYYGVSDIIAQGSAVYGQKVRIEGMVVPGSIEKESAGRIIRFTVADKEKEGSLRVVFQGVAPDTFQDDSEVVVEGSLGSDGVFRASALMARCPSRYEPETQT